MILNSNEYKISKDDEKMKNNNHNRFKRPDITSNNQKLEKNNWRNNIPHSVNNQIRNAKSEQNILHDKEIKNKYFDEHNISNKYINKINTPKNININYPRDLIKSSYNININNNHIERKQNFYNPNYQNKIDNFRNNIRNINYSNNIKNSNLLYKYENNQQKNINNDKLILEKNQNNFIVNNNIINNPNKFHRVRFTGHDIKINNEYNKFKNLKIISNEESQNDSEEAFKKYLPNRSNYKDIPVYSKNIEQKEYNNKGNNQLSNINNKNMYDKNFLNYNINNNNKYIEDFNNFHEESRLKDYYGKLNQDYLNFRKLNNLKSNKYDFINDKGISRIKNNNNKKIINSEKSIPEYNREVINYKEIYKGQNNKELLKYNNNLENKNMYNFNDNSTNLILNSYLDIKNIQKNPPKENHFFKNNNNNIIKNQLQKYSIFFFK
jgi:hypothetical protein